MAESGGGGVEDAGGSLTPSHTNGGDGGAGSTWEIEELEPDERPPRSVAASTASSGADNDVYVAVGKGGSSMAALS